MNVAPSSPGDDEASWDEACRREEEIQRWVPQDPSGALGRAAVREAAAKLGISVATLYRLIQRFCENRRVSVLLPRRAGRPVGTRFISEGVEAIIQAAVREVYLVPERPTFRELVRQVATRCRKRGEQPPDARTIRRRVDDVDPFERARLRKDEAAQEAMAATPGKLQVEKPLDLVQIDHTQMDIVVVDEETPVCRSALADARHRRVLPNGDRIRTVVRSAATNVDRPLPASQRLRVDFH